MTEKIDVANLKLRNNTEARQYEMALFGDDIALVTYRLRGDVLTLLHTEVPPEYKGQGIAEKLTRDVFEEAKAHGWKIAPSCPYSAVYVKRHPEVAPMTVPVDEG
jgi:predicted GNAT family acetyltransferase